MTTVEKRGNVLDHLEARKSWQLLPEAVTVQKPFLNASKTDCLGNTKKFWKPHETHELKGGNNMSESVDLLKCENPSNIYCQRDLESSDHDLFNEKDKEAFHNFVEYYLTRGRHEYIFCSAVQIASWWWRLRACTEEAEYGAEEIEVF